MRTFQDQPAPDPTTRMARLAVSTIFFVNGTVFASWVPHIPFVQTRLDLSEGVLGLALLAIAAGAVTSLTLSGWLVGRFGSRRVTSVATLFFCAVLPLPILAPDLPLLIPALILLGMANGAMDVAMNAQGVAVENRYPWPIMSSFHGLFSLGGLFGAGLGGVLLSTGVHPLGHVLGVALVMGVIGLVALTRLLPDGPVDTTQPVFALPPRPVIGLSFLAFFSLVGEGAMADWSAVYLRNWLGAGPGLAAAGFAAFSLMMAVGRLTGDRLKSRFGPVDLVRYSTALAAAGLGLALLLGHPAAAIVGFGCVGLGLANVVPILFSAAGRTPGVGVGTAIAAVATVGYLGFLAGPPFIGFTAEVVSLPGALWLVVAAIASVAVFSHIIGRANNIHEPAPEAPEQLGDSAG